MRNRYITLYELCLSKILFREFLLQKFDKCIQNISIYNKSDCDNFRFASDVFYQYGCKSVKVT